MSKIKPVWGETTRKRIVYCLKKTGLTPNAASERAGLNRSVLRKLLNGAVKELRDSNLKDIAKALGVTPAFLRGESDELGELAPPVAQKKTPAKLRAENQRLRSELAKIRYMIDALLKE